MADPQMMSLSKMSSPLLLLLLLLVGTCVGQQDPPAASSSDASVKWIPCDATDTFLCDIDDKCISKDRQCDATLDCGDGSDEEGCLEKPFVERCSGEHLFECKSGECISRYWKCDGEFDCHDKSDEVDCDPFVKQDANCTEGERKCATSGMCLPEDWWCDGQVDCTDASDEDGPECANKTCTEFQCGDKLGHCIPHRWVCDGSADCDDESDEDESMCSQNVDPKDCTLEAGLFLCADQKQCVNATSMCNQTHECEDKSDEAPFCSQACQDHNCAHACTPTPMGAKCICDEGYSKTADERCVDIDECAEYGRCSQVCVNTMGSYRCACKEGYHMDKDNVCRAFHGQPVLYFSTKTEIRGLNLHDPKGNFFLVSPNVSHSGQAIGVAMDSAEGRIYWSAISSGDEGIFTANPDGTGKEYFIKDGLQMVEDLALDHMARNLYFTDSANQFIGVASLRTKQWGILLNTTKAAKIRAIAVYPPEGLMFYTDWGSSPGVIRAGMDGSKVVSVISEDVIWPNGVTVDVVMKRIFWSDAKLNRLESARFDGHDRRRVLDESAKHPFSLAVFEDTLFWSDWQAKEIQSCNKFNGKNHTIVIKERKLVPYGITISHRVLETRPFSGRNPCSNHRCSHMCLLTPELTAKCFCPKNTDRIDDLSCEEVKTPPMMNPRIRPFTDGPMSRNLEDSTEATKTQSSTETTDPKPADQGFMSRMDTVPPSSQPEEPSSTPSTPITPTVSEETTFSSDNSVKHIPMTDSQTDAATSDEKNEVTIIIIVIIIVIIILALLAFFYIRNRRNNKAPVAMVFRNREFRHGRMASGSEELKNVQVLRKHSDGTFQNMSASPMPMPTAAASYNDLNDEFNPRLGHDGGMKRSRTNPNMAGMTSAPVMMHEGRLAGAESQISSPLGSSPGSDDDELDVFSADRLGDKARLL